MNTQDMSNKELVETARSLWNMIYDAECYGVRDMFYLSEALEELEKRGYEIRESTKLSIKSPA